MKSWSNSADLISQETLKTPLPVHPGDGVLNWGGARIGANAENGFKGGAQRHIRFDHCDGGAKICQAEFRDLVDAILRAACAMADA